LAENKKVDKVKKVLDTIEEWEEHHRTGYVQINFFKGGISSVHKHEVEKV